MKKIIILCVTILLSVLTYSIMSTSAIGDVAATIKYCDRNAERAVSNAVANVEFALPGLVTNQVNKFMADKYVPRFVTNTVNNVITNGIVNVETNIIVDVYNTTNVTTYVNIVSNVTTYVNVITNFNYDYSTNIAINIATNYETHVTNITRHIEQRIITNVWEDVFYYHYITNYYNVVITTNINYSIYNSDKLYDFTPGTTYTDKISSREYTINLRCYDKDDSELDIDWIATFKSDSMIKYYDPDLGRDFVKYQGSFRTSPYGYLFAYYVNLVFQYLNNSIERKYIEVAFYTKQIIYLRKGLLGPVIRQMNPGDILLIAFTKGIESSPFNQSDGSYSISDPSVVAIWQWGIDGNEANMNPIVQGSVIRNPITQTTATPSRYIDGSKNYRGTTGSIVTTIPTWSELIKYLEFNYQKRSGL